MSKDPKEEDSPHLKALSDEHTVICHPCRQRNVAHYLGVEQVSTNLELLETSKNMYNTSFQQAEVTKGMSAQMIKLADITEVAMKETTKADKAKADAEQAMKEAKKRIDEMAPVKQTLTLVQKIVAGVMALVALLGSYGIGAS